MPPEKLNWEEVYCLPSVVRPITCADQTAPGDSASTRSGTTLCSAVRIGIGTYMPTTWRAATGAGYSQFTMLRRGAVTLIGARLPALFGRSGVRQERTANVEYAWV